jgi:hypothetical protein
MQFVQNKNDDFVDHEYSYLITIILEDEIAAGKIYF